MARLSAAEFEQLIEILVSVQGLAKIQQKLMRLNALVSRRRAGSPQTLATQLYLLTGGLERDGIASRAVLAVWEEFLGSRIDEEASKQLESMAERINACLTPALQLDTTKEPELRAALDHYREALASRVGEPAARITMINRAVPDVARILRQA